MIQGYTQQDSRSAGGWIIVLETRNAEFGNLVSKKRIL